MGMPVVTKPITTTVIISAGRKAQPGIDRFEQDVEQDEAAEREADGNRKERPRDLGRAQDPDGIGRAQAHHEDLDDSEHQRAEREAAGRTLAEYALLDM